MRALQVLAQPVRVLIAAAFLYVTPAAHCQVSNADGDAAKGRAIALEGCTSCHRVESQQRSPPVLPKAPSFAAIARAKGTTAISLKVFLNSSHNNMPNFILSADEQSDVISYILSLRGPH